MTEENFEIDKALELSNIRDLYDKPSEKEEALVTREISTPFMSFLDKETFSDKERLLRVLNEQKNLYGKTLSISHICARLLLRITEATCSEEIELSHKNKKAGHFRFFYDFKAGADMVLSSIAIAENAPIDASEKIDAEIVNKTPLASQGVEAYLELRKTDKAYSDLLHKDKTGFLLVDHVAEEIGKEKSTYLEPTWSREYVLSGAKFARDCYKKLYKIAEPLSKT